VLEAILNIPNLKGLFWNLWCRQRPNRRLVSKSIKKAISTGLHRKCDTMLWRKCQYGTIWDQYRHERNWSDLWKDITTEAGITKLMYLGAKYSCKGFQNRVWDFFTRWNDIILDFTFLNQFFCVICKPK
jgi:hypothetical protein